MATAVLVSDLASSYEPDREWVNGEVIERSTTTTAHSYAQGRLSRLAVPDLDSHLHAFQELRVRVGNRYRIIDPCIYAGIPETVPQSPPIVAVEVLYRFDDGLHAVASVSVPEHGISVTAADLFRGL